MRVIDTNILIYYLQDSDKHVTEKLDTWRSTHEKLVISTITQTELLSLSSLSDADIEQIERFIATLILVNVDPPIARMAAFFRRNYPIKLADAIIAATAFLSDCPVVTRNTKDFNKIPAIVIDSL